MALSLTNPIEIIAYGVPRAKGSMKAFINKKTGKPIITGISRASKDWQQTINFAAQEAAVKLEKPLEGPIQVNITFWVPIPKHISKRKERPLYPITRPDLDKNLRCAIDGLTGVIFKDDSQVVVIIAAKEYGEQPGVRILVQEIEE